MQQGELTVTGSDHATIPLHRGLPAKVECFFKDNDVVIPCNPHHYDTLQFAVHSSNKHHGGFELRISWEVSGMREILWRVLY